MNEADNKGTILYYGGFYLPDKSASANRVVANGKLFEKLGYRVVLLGQNYEETFSGVRKTGVDRMFEEAHPNGNLEWLGSILFARNLISMAERLADLKCIFLYNTPYSVVLAARRYCKKRNIKLVYDCTEWSEVTLGSAVKRAVKKRDLRAIKDLMPKRVDGIITISSMMDRQYAGQTILRLPPLVDIEDDIWRQEPIRVGDGFEFCFAGRIDGSKDALGLLVRAFAGLDFPDAVLRIIGVTREEFLRFHPNEEAILAQIGSVVFMGVLPHDETLRYIMGSDCCVLIRIAGERSNAVFPTKFAEYYTCGVPIIASAVSDIGEYACDRVTLLDDDSEETVTAALSRAVEKFGSRPAGSRKTDRRFDFRSYEGAATEWAERLGLDPGR